MARTDAFASAIMAAGTLVSRVLGFVKAILLTVAIGSISNVGDVFETANTLPNLIYVLVAGGVFNSVLVPQIIKAAQAQDGGLSYISKLVTLTVTAIGIVTAITVACAVPIIHIMGASWTPEQQKLGVIFALWCLPQIFFYGLYTVIGQVLNAKDAFGSYMWSPVLNNIITIAALIGFIALFGPQDTSTIPPAHSVENWTSAQTLVLAGSATLGVAVQALVLFIPLFRMGLRIRPDFAWRGIGLREAAKLAGWTLASGVISNIAFMYMTQVAASVVSSRDYYAAQGIEVPGLQALNYATMLYMLPHGVVGVSIATVLFNRLSASSIADDSDSVIYAFSRGLRNSGVATVFCAVALVIMAGPVATLFSGGNPKAAIAIAQLIIILAPATPLLTVNFMYTRVLFARENAKTPFNLQLFSSITMALMSFGASLLPAPYVVFALAAIYPINSFLMLITGHVAIRRRLGDYEGLKIISSYARSFFASVGAALPALLVLYLLGAWNLSGFALGSKMGAVISLVIAGSIMAICYVPMMRLVGLHEGLALVAPLTRRLKTLSRR
ncbi:MAG: lipid II flippase MurJ [Rothia sp. (in: high G+C Gram-positive bacteria)]|uniref:murein biosynthesis integral membrane protein MurJ n=1 Tax=Rothia sp. (in: high G+C Gram-positive bacteria) TaxID=1885016 RepID=UPI0026E1006C|nr:lipid II flippase MurJ [Rothia sp. (in: high G+C Gram-positive bacteria)]MDO5749587.1 lipid II flippase MurJ [Rothia sp. (in: high G+C Gram-positive bacteria)]